MAEYQKKKCHKNNHVGSVPINTTYKEKLPSTFLKKRERNDVRQRNDIGKKNTNNFMYFKTMDKNSFLLSMDKLKMLGKT